MLAGRTDMEGCPPDSPRNKKKGLMQVRVRYTIGTLSGLEERSDGILLVSEKNHGVVW